MKITYINKKWVMSLSLRYKDTLISLSYDKDFKTIGLYKTIYSGSFGRVTSIISLSL